MSSSTSYIRSSFVDISTDYLPTSIYSPKLTNHCKAHAVWSQETCTDWSDQITYPSSLFIVTTMTESAPWDDSLQFSHIHPSPSCHIPDCSIDSKLQGRHVQWCFLGIQIDSQNHKCSDKLSRQQEHCETVGRGLIIRQRISGRLASSSRLWPAERQRLVGPSCPIPFRSIWPWLISGDQPVQTDSKFRQSVRRVQREDTQPRG